MTTEDRDPLLQSLFDQAHQELDGESFTAEVVAKSRFLRYRAVAPWIALAAALAASTLFLTIPLQEFALLVTRALSTTLIDLGSGWVAWVLAPVNNAASLLVLSVKAARMLRRRIIRASYAA